MNIPNPNPKVDVRRKKLHNNSITNKIWNDEKVLKMENLSRERAEFLTTCTEKEYNEYKRLRTNFKESEKKT